MSLPLSLYIHIPWCVQKCPYCDFNSHAIKAPLNEQTYIAHLLTDFTADYDGRPIHSIFIGGGTPSVFSGAGIAALLEGIFSRANLTPDCEITLEANPSTAEQQRFADYLAAGVNRLSIGIQSFNPAHLKRLGRAHSATEAEEAIRLAQKVGFNRINLDIMFALSNQSVSQALEDLKRAIAFETEHLSWYQLTIEPNTSYYRNPPPLPSEHTQIQIYEQGSALLTQAGFDQYETSAWTRALPAQHNLNYWQFGDYLGIGAGAHGKLTRITEQGQWLIRRDSKYRAPSRYQSAYTPCTYPHSKQVMAQNPYVAQQQLLTDAELPFEFMMNALRLRAGVPSTLFTERTGLTLDKLVPTLEKLSQKQLIEPNYLQQLKTTERGFILLNDVLMAFL